MRGLHLAIFGVLILAGCSSQEPRTTAGLDESVPLNRSQDPGTLVYRSPTLQTGKYKSLLIENTEVYTGKDADFGKTSEADKKRLANKVTEDFTAELTKRKYPLTEQPGPGVVRLRLKLTGVQSSRSVASTALRLTPLGLGLSAAKEAEGKSAAFVGSVTIAGEMIDAQSGEILGAFVATESPIALDVTSGLGSLRAAELGIERGADNFADALDRAVGRKH